jgi:hypothetical protein
VAATERNWVKRVDIRECDLKLFDRGGDKTKLRRVSERFAYRNLRATKLAGTRDQVLNLWLKVDEVHPICGRVDGGLFFRLPGLSRTGRVRQQGLRRFSAG